MQHAAIAYTARLPRFSSTDVLFPKFNANSILRELQPQGVPELRLCRCTCHSSLYCQQAHHIVPSNGTVCRAAQCRKLLGIAPNTFAITPDCRLLPTGRAPTPALIARNTLCQPLARALPFNFSCLRIVRTVARVLNERHSLAVICHSSRTLVESPAVRSIGDLSGSSPDHDVSRNSIAALPGVEEAFTIAKM